LPVVARKVDVARERLDKVLVERGLAESRERAQALILAGSVKVDGQTVRRAAAPVGPEARIELAARLPYVSRGGLKLQHALTAFGLDVRDLTLADVGASTGGFTDCLLQRGAARVYAIDVGRGQLDWRLRNDRRVVVMERTHARDLAGLPEPIDAAVADLSFISLAQVLPSVFGWLRPGGWVVALVKPQFEAGRDKVGRGGVVRDPAVHAQVLRDLAAALAARGWPVRGLTPSPITGPAGNREFLIHVRADADAPTLDLEGAIGAAVEPVADRPPAAGRATAC
jgi:23S rRNA (cytidine1920-2'-O)/16S rRNA (cytidine1409-2'-O)-methyltransferase